MDIDGMALICIMVPALMLMMFAAVSFEQPKEKQSSNGQQLMAYLASTYNPKQPLSDPTKTEQTELRESIKILTTPENIKTFKNIAILSAVAFFTMITLGSILCFFLLKYKRHQKKKIHFHEKITDEPEPIQSQESQRSDVFLDLIKQLQMALDCQSLASQNITLHELAVIIVKIRKKQRENPDCSMILPYSTSFAETATRLLMTYLALEKEQDVSLKYISMIKHEIIESFPVFLRYYRNMLNRMYEQQYYDVSSDVEVVKSLNNGLHL